ncbi:putative sporulation protein YtxC [Paenibacillus residui]|uniref:Sporulation protein YtxC n=1 Tax=Paenibacillus residui TaxID=629724 RepID=A0ABW3DJD6_9BACL
MRLFQLYLPDMPDNHYAALVQTLKKELHKINKSENVYQLKYETDRFMVTVHWVSGTQGVLKQESRKMAGTAIGRVLAEYIVDCEEIKIIRRITRSQYRCSPDETEKICSYCKELLDGTLDYSHPFDLKGRRKAKVSAILQSYLWENPVLHLDGFIRFRLGDYNRELAEAVDYAVEEIMLDQQYQDFIALLKYYVYAQDTIIPTAHLMHKGGHEFQLLNEHMKPIDPRLFHFNKGESFDAEESDEDLIVSALLSVSPQKIYIHTREPELQVIKTIQQIFEHRVELCTVLS